MEGNFNYPNEQPKQTNSLWLLLIVIALVAVAFAAYFFWPQSSNATSITGAEAAEEMLGFIESQRVEGGYFNRETECLFGREVACQPLTQSHAVGHDHVFHFGQIILALADYAAYSGDENYQNEMEDIMGLIRDDCLSNGNIEVCEWNFYPTHRFYKETGDERFLEMMLKTSDKFLDPALTYDVAVEKNIGIKLWMLYDATGEERYRERLVSLAQAAIPAVTTQPESSLKVRETVNLFYGLLTPAHRATGDSSYLEVMSTYFQMNDLSSFVAALPPNDINTNTAARLVDTLNYIASQVPEAEAAQYDAIATQILGLILRDRIDLSAAPKFDGDAGAFVARFNSRDVAVKDTQLTGSLIKLLLRFPEHEFSLSPVE